MRENISKNDSAIVYLVFGIPLLFLIGYMLYSLVSGPSLHERIKRRNLDEDIHGTVDSLYFNIQNHGITFAILKDQREIPINGGWERFIEVGDSISKNKNSFIFQIYKKNKTKIVLDYRDTYKKNR